MRSDRLRPTQESRLHPILYIRKVPLDRDDFLFDPAHGAVYCRQGQWHSYLGNVADENHREWPGPDWWCRHPWLHLAHPRCQVLREPISHILYYTCSHVHLFMQSGTFIMVRADTGRGSTLNYRVIHRLTCYSLLFERVVQLRQPFICVQCSTLLKGMWCVAHAPLPRTQHYTPTCLPFTHAYMSGGKLHPLCNNRRKSSYAPTPTPSAPTQTSLTDRSTQQPRTHNTNIILIPLQNPYICPYTIANRYPSLSLHAQRRMLV